MEYVHVRNLEKYHPGYKDRTLQWGKIYINMADGDPDTEMITNEIDWARLIKMVLLELRAQKPLPNSEEYWRRKGFDLKKRPMSVTLQMLHNFIVVVTEESGFRYETVTQMKSKKRKEKEKDEEEDSSSYSNSLKEKQKWAMLYSELEGLKKELDDWKSVKYAMQAEAGRWSEWEIDKAIQALKNKGK